MSVTAVVVLQAEFRRDVSGLTEFLERGHFSWLIERSKVMWPEWIEALDSLSQKRPLEGRTKKTVRVFTTNNERWCKNDNDNELCRVNH